MKSPNNRNALMWFACTSMRASISPAGKRRACCTFDGGFSP
jgi:hypothetical protein